MGVRADCRDESANKFSELVEFNRKIVKAAVCICGLTIGLVYITPVHTVVALLNCTELINYETGGHF